MRDIKFRGKTEVSKKWCYGNLCIRRDGAMIITPGETPLGTYGKVDRDTVGQYTGLKDKNGTEIYEGDILQIPEWLQEDSQDKCICIYMQENQVSDIIGFGLYIKDGYSGKYKVLVPSDEWDEFEVMGNIYDNPELFSRESEGVR